jgi:hypothetical protein
MSKPKIKPELIGCKTNSKTLSGMITIDESHADMFFREGRWDLLVMPDERELKPIEVVTDQAKKKKKNKG